MTNNGKDNNSKEEQQEFKKEQQEFNTKKQPWENPDLQKVEHPEVLDL